MKLSEIAKILNIEYNLEDRDIKKLSSLSSASKEDLAYCENSNLLDSTKAGVVLIRQKDAHLLSDENYPMICENPHLNFAILSKYFAKPIISKKSQSYVDESTKIMPNVYIGSSCNIGKNCLIMHGAYIGDNVKIGDNVIIYPNVVIYNDTMIGDFCILHANCVIGSDGFGYATDKFGKHHKIYHNGRVIIKDFVEIGANSTIDRGVFDDTIIQNNTKIDNLVQIAHNCELGEGCIIVAQSGIAGSSKLGKYVVMGGQSGTAGHVSIGDRSQIAARGGVVKNIKGDKKYAGFPLLELKDYLKLQAKILKFFNLHRN